VQTTPINPISRKRRLKFLVGGAFVATLVIGLVVLAMAREGSTAYYMTTTELSEQATLDNTKDYRVNGTVVPGSIQQDGIETAFTITDGTTQMTIVTEDPLPDTFKDNSEVVARGAYDGSSFEATEVLAKCPSKFKAKD
jgi:cytochrome c-type biogenesis protein CcmE